MKVEAPSSTASQPVCSGCCCLNQGGFLLEGTACALSGAQPYFFHTERSELVVLTWRSEWSPFLPAACCQRTSVCPWGHLCQLLGHLRAVASARVLPILPPLHTMGAFVPSSPARLKASCGNVLCLGHLGPRCLAQSRAHPGVHTAK